MTKKTRAARQVSRFERANLPLFLRRLHPHDTAKAVAADLARSHHTVKNWLDGTAAPDAEAFGDMIGVYGAPFVCAVMDPPPAWASDAMARAELAELEELSARLRQKLKQADPV